MSTYDSRVTSEELGWELVEVFDGLQTDEINELLAKNVPLDTLRFFAGYAEQVGEAESIQGDARKRLPNMLLLGYLLRLLEERLIPDEDD